MTPPDNNPDYETMPSNLTLIEKMQDVGISAKIDFRNTNLYGKSILFALGAMTAYEWGPGNETLTPIIGGEALDVSNGVKGVAVTALITGGFTVCQQLASSWLTRKSVQRFPTVAEKTFEYMNGSDNLEEELRFKPFKELPLVKKGLYPVTVGASFVVSREASVTGKTDDESLKSVGRKSAVITGGAVAVIATLIDVIDQKIPEDWGILRGVADFITTPVPYLLAVGGVLGNDYIKSRKHKKLQNLQN